MRRYRLVHSVLLLILFALPTQAVKGQVPARPSSPDSVNDITLDISNSNTPSVIMDLIRTSQAKYADGSNLIKSGESEKARQSFNEAVDMILQSNWDLASTPKLNIYFQELIQRVQEDESLYLLGPSDKDDQIENAVVDDLDNVDLIPIQVDPALRNSLAEDLAKTKYEIPITINEMVVKSLDFWLNGGRKFFADGLVRSGKYKPIIEKVFREESIPLDLMYLAQVESLFKPHAVSKAQAKGIWQFEKDTAIRYGLKVTKDVDERSDPEKSTRAAARYLNDLFATFKDWNLALAAYNWGEGKVQRLIESTGLKDFWQLVDLRRRLPEETKNHIPMIQASVILARNAEKYGLPTKLDPPLKYSEVSVSKPIDLNAAAKALSTTIDELKKLNPALKGSTTPANYPDYQLKIPAGTDSKAPERLNALPAAVFKPASDEYSKHKVKPGENLVKIAAQHHVTIAEIEKANHLSSKDKLLAGTSIKVPVHATARTKEVKSEVKKGKAANSKIPGKSGRANAKKSNAGEKTSTKLAASR
jgi:membrane-bound lytic murein transglycosylase D